MDVDVSRLTDVDYLRSFGIDPNFFGLGFIQLKLNKNERVHFWHPRISSVVDEEELHDHRYNFKSTIMVGNITHEVWNFEADYEGNGDHVMSLVTCQPNSPKPDADPINGRVWKTHEYNFTAGSSYTVGHNDFHRIRASLAMTYVKREPVIKELATVIRARTGEVACPFTHHGVAQVNTDDCWNIINEVINGIPHGYHTRKIDKGVYGESSKILEEALELEDAVKQNNPVMALCELSDIVGAIEEYLRRKHPSMNLTDLQVMAKATARAFKDGAR